MESQCAVEQTVIYRSLKSRARAEYDKVKEMLDAFVANTLDNDPVSAIPPYIESTQTVSVRTFNSLADKGDLAEGVLYQIPCAGREVLRPTGLIRNIGIYTNCVIDVRKDPKTTEQKPKKASNPNGGGANGKQELCDPDVDTCEDVPWIAEVLPPMLTCETAIAEGYEPYTTGLDTAPGRTYRDSVTVDTDPQECAKEPGATGLWDNVFVFSTAFETGDASHTALSFPNNMQIGRVDGCAEGGGVRVYTSGSIATPAGTVVHGSQFVALGDVGLAAKIDGTYGLSIQAEGDIRISANGYLGGCPFAEEELASDVVATVRPVAIVN